MKQVRISNDTDETITITLPNGENIEVEPGGEFLDDDVSTQLIVIHKPK